MKTLYLIDANALIHRSFHALPPLTSPEGKPVQALYGLSTILLRLMREDKPEYIAACFDRPEPTFRKAEYDNYKAQREKTVDELVTQIIESPNVFQKFGMKTLEAPGFEADDLLGTLSERFKGTPDLKIVILTGDLDTLQLVDNEHVFVRALKTGIRDSVLYDESAVLERYGIPPKALPDYKAIAGDASDNIPGLAGAGPKTASALLKKYGTIEGIYEHLNAEPKFASRYADKKTEALLYKRLATIRHDAPTEIADLEDLRVRPDVDALAEYFASLGFESLVKRVKNGESTDTASTKPRVVSQTTSRTRAQGELFNHASAPKGPVALYIAAGAPPTLAELDPKLIKVGFHLKERLKQAMERGSTIVEPLADLGVGFWLLDSDFRKYEPEAIFKKFLKREWAEASEEENLRLAYVYLSEKIETEGLAKVFEKIEMPLIPILVVMERHGFLIDRSVLRALQKNIGTEIEKLRKEVYALAGGPLNLNSPKQLAELLFTTLNLKGGKERLTKTGQRSTNAASLEDLAGAHPIVDKLLNYRELFKLSSTYIEPILAFTEKEPRLHTDFIQTGAATGRLASQNPNLQNIPATTSNAWVMQLRSAFIASPKHRLLAIDYSQLELRILATLSGDERMTLAFKSGKDIHAATAAYAFKVSEDKVTSDMRRVAKALNFGIVYGMGANAFARTAGVSVGDARAFIQEYFRTYPGIREWQERIKEYGRTYGYVVNENGRRRNVVGITFGKTRIAAEAERIAVNMPIQSLNADIIKLAMIRASREIEAKPEFRGRVHILLSIHDELLFEVHEAILNEVQPFLVALMEGVYTLKVPLMVRAKTGRHWGELA